MYCKQISVSEHRFSTSAFLLNFAAIFTQESGIDEHSSLLRNPIVNSSNSIPHTRCTMF